MSVVVTIILTKDEARLVADVIQADINERTANAHYYNTKELLQVESMKLVVQKVERAIRR